MHACRRASRTAALLLIVAMLAAPGAWAQGLPLPGAARQTGQTAREQAVPDASALKPGWWEYLAPQEPGLEQRITALLDNAGTRAASLPEPLAADGARALGRLRTSLAALAALIAVQPAPLEALPAPAPSYTTTAILALDRELRDIQADRDERQSAIAVAERAVRDGQRQLDATFAGYLAGSVQGPERIRTGLQVMAGRAEIAVTEAEIRLRRTEAQDLGERIAAMRRLRDEGSTRIVPDAARPPEKLQALIAKNRAQLEERRTGILRTRAERGELVSRTATSRTAGQLADLAILGAIIEENLVAARIGLYETELDWLQIADARPDAAAVAGISQRLAERRTLLAQLDADSVEWRSEIERLIAASLDSTVNSPAGAAADPQITRLADTGRRTLVRLARLRSLREDLRFALDTTTRQLAAVSGWRGWLQAHLLTPARVVAERADDLLRTSLFRISDAPVTAYGLLRVVLIMTLAIVASRLARRLLARFGSRQPGRASAGLYTIGRLLHYVLITAGLMIGLASIGLDFSQLALVAGALSIGIGFGLQSVVNNFVSGLMILFEKSLKIGDVVELDSGVRGAVREIRVRSTLITTSDGVDIIVPNAEFVAGKVTNFTLNEPYHRIHVPFGVAYESDKEQVRAVVIEAARGVPFTHVAAGREPDVWLVRLGDNSLDFELVVWINPTAVTRPGAVMATYLWEIESVLRHHGIEIPFPQRDVHLRLSPDEFAGLATAPRTPDRERPGPA